MTEEMFIGESQPQRLQYPFLCELRVEERFGCIHFFGGLQLCFAVEVAAEVGGGTEVCGGGSERNKGTERQGKREI